MSDAPTLTRVLARPASVAGYLLPLAGCLLLLALFHEEAVAAVQVWLTSTAYGHGFLVLPIAAWLAWERRAQILAEPLRPLPAAAMLVVPCAMVWLVADRLSLMEGRQLVVLVLVWIMALAVLGWRSARAAAVPLGYLIFLVPFGAFLVPALQDFTAHFVDQGLELLGIPHFVDNRLIDIPEGTFLVAEACAGLRFLIAAIAFGVLYAVSIYRSTWRRLIFLAVSIIVPIIANGMRALGIVLLGHVRGSAEAGVVDHVVYGWLFFSAVILLLVLLGLPFREDGMVPTATPWRGAVPIRRQAGSLLLVVLLSSAAPALARMLDARADSESVALDAQAGGEGVMLPAPCRPVSDVAGQQRFLCGSTGLSLRRRRFGPHASAALILSALREAEPVPIMDEDVSYTRAEQPGGDWLIAQTARPEAATAETVCIDGRLVTGGWSMRVSRAWASLIGGRDLPLAVTVAAAGPGADALVRGLITRPDVVDCRG